MIDFIFKLIFIGVSFGLLNGLRGSGHTSKVVSYLGMSYLSCLALNLPLFPYVFICYGLVWLLFSAGWGAYFGAIAERETAIGEKEFKPVDILLAKLSLTDPVKYGIIGMSLRMLILGIPLMVLNPFIMLAYIASGFIYRLSYKFTGLKGNWVRNAEFLVGLSIGITSCL